MKKITTGTGVGKDSIMVQGIKVAPYGATVCVIYPEDVARAVALGWEKSEGWYSSRQMFVPPKEVYQCLKYYHGDECYEGSQTLLIEE